MPSYLLLVNNNISTVFLTISGGDNTIRTFERMLAAAAHICPAKMPAEMRLSLHQSEPLPVDQ